MDPEFSQERQRLRAGDSVQLERDSGECMKGIVVLVEPEGIDLVVDGTIVRGEILSVSRTVRDDGRYTAVTEVVDAGRGRTRIRLMGDWKRVQLREFVRVEVGGVSIEVSGGARLGNAIAGEDGAPRLVDVSAGGLRFESPAAYEMGSVLEIGFTLPHAGPISVRGEVVRKAETRGPTARPCHYGVRFLDLDEAMRVKLMTWVFAEQARRFRRKSEAEIPAAD